MLILLMDSSMTAENEADVGQGQICKGWLYRGAYLFVEYWAKKGDEKREEGRASGLCQVDRAVVEAEAW